MDKIIIKDLEIFAFHGVMEEEKKLGQKFILSLELYVNLREAGLSDDLNKTVHYGILAQEIEELFTSKSFDLIEKAAEEVANYILVNYEIIEKVKVTLKKPWAPILKPVDYVAVEIFREKHKAFVAVGANMGDKRKNIEEAFEIINSSSHCKIKKISEFYETEPVGYTEQDDFLNCAIEIETLLTPIELVRFLLSVEKNLKRERIIKWGPRTIDLDVILYDNIVSSDEEIIIPHPRMHERAFVLEPLNDIAPYEIHPILRKRVFELLKEVH
ncbi:dihydroneopterin aldolase / 2-amino-4-hydroxy-6-hydroxymethyldihydropteridine diphosphokinase [Clostridium collagenovorans DSM 3089]|uniref:Bifunctional folate synthesis protein n=1 Tax=Clostridium collagenovorans DSM 3089 TaxID=1121306 RepID=A0A1M5TXM2_9CLOT|nr:2-amino-4-hydroxy-6-hydroxymethyldihydropteridine diphosphokinase [Clostridium collagenovorans]SHH55444.1 dihydroneopterin aldolase / 2-amino-4-hydroxy-6-hydroxymethyldihydropteridine diphosphokinase [Clostridium collagenovorans DSM 3089]